MTRKEYYGASAAGKHFYRSGVYLVRFLESTCLTIYARTVNGAGVEAAKVKRDWWSPLFA